MAKTLPISFGFFPAATHLSLRPRHGVLGFPLSDPRRAGARVRMSIGGFPQPNGLPSAFNLDGIASRMDGLFFTLADAVVAMDPSTSEVTAAHKNGGWLSLISETMEIVLKILKDRLSAVHVPYAYGFAIILLTVMVKAATFPLTKKQVESTLSMQSLQPKIKAIQERFAGNPERVQLETAQLYKQAGVNPLVGIFATLVTIPVWVGLYQALSNVANEGLLTEGFFWIPSLGGPTTIAAQQSGSGISWLIPFVDGHPPLGWSDTAAYLALPVLLVLSQYISMEIMKPPQTDPTSKNSLLISKFFPLMIGYFSLSVPSGLSIYWLTNNVLSTAQHLWLRKLGGAKFIVSQDDGDTISAEQPKTAVRTGERFKQIKEEEARKKTYNALQAEKDQIHATDSESGDLTDGKLEDEAADEACEPPSGNKGLPDYTGLRKSKGSNRKRLVQ